MMEYKIVPYSSDLFTQVVNLMRFLWGDNHQANASYFQWKHLDNPYIEYPLGVVALSQNDVVGFRGYFATKWLIGSHKDAVVILHPGDTCVHPNHRMKGLSQAMGQKAVEEYQAKYKIFFNLSSSPNSFPGYVKLGFFPLAPKTPLVIFKKHKGLNDFIPLSVKNRVKNSKIFGLVKSIARKKKESPTTQKNIIYGEYGHIEVADCPKPREMANVIAHRTQGSDKIRLLQDEDFFRWRYNNKKNGYYFYYCRTDNTITGYLVIGVSKEDVGRGNILDYAESDGTAIEKILEFLISAEHFKVILMESYGLNDDIKEALKRLGLKKNYSSRKSGKFYPSEVPLLIRPIREDLSENDWFIDGVDIRNIDHWEIKPISSDGW